MKLIIGLGNPDKKYKKTRHNFGFLAIDYFQSNSGDFDKWTPQEEFNSLICEGKIGDEKIILAKPQTFMNRSGEAVVKLVNFHKTDLKDTWVIHDDCDLPLGVIRISKNASAAGHKGADSIIKKLGSKNFVRFRLGIHPVGQTFLTIQFKKRLSLEKFVLKNFCKPELAIVQKTIKKTAQAIETAVKEGMEKAMSEFN